MTQMLVLLAAQYRGDQKQGTLRRYDEARFQWFWSTSADETPPLVGTPNTVSLGDIATVSLGAGDPSGILAALLTYTADDGTWATVKMDTAGDGVYRANVALAASEIDYFIQVVDLAGNVNYALPATGSYFHLPPAAPRAAATPTTTATTTPTATPGPQGLPAIGGSGLGIAVDRHGDVALTWTGGQRHTGYRVARVSPARDVTLLPHGAPLPAGATSFADHETRRPGLWCYAVLPESASGVLGRSDTLCLFPDTESSKAAPGDFTLRLNQSGTATLSWTPPGSQSGYVLWRIPLVDGRPQEVVPLPAEATTASVDTQGVPACFVLVALRGGALASRDEPLTGNSSALCGVPGQSTLNGSGASLPQATNAGVEGGLTGLMGAIPRETGLGGRTLPFEGEVSGGR